MEFRDPKIFGPKNGSELMVMNPMGSQSVKNHQQNTSKNLQLPTHQTFQVPRMVTKTSLDSLLLPPYSLPRPWQQLGRSLWPQGGGKPGKGYAAAVQGGSLPLQGVILKGGAHLMPRGFRNLNFTL